MHAALDEAIAASPDAAADAVAEPITPAPSRRLEVGVAVIALVFSLAMLWLATQIELRREAGAGQIDARFWPTVLGVLGVGLSLWRLVIALVRPAPERDDLEPIRAGGPVRLLATIGLTTAYIALWGLRGAVATLTVVPLFVVITPIFLALLVLLYGGRSWQSVLLYPGLVTVFAYLLFGTLLRIPL